MGAAQDKWKTLKRNNLLVIGLGEAGFIFFLFLLSRKQITSIGHSSKIVRFFYICRIFY